MIRTRKGITRRVFITRRWAIKVPRLAYWRSSRARGPAWSFSRGIQANLSELEWSGVKGVNDVVWCSPGGLIAVQRRAHPVTGVLLWRAGLLDLPDATTAAQVGADDLGALEKVIRWRAISDVHMAGDRKLNNIGVVDGEVVWIDYDQSWNACPHHPGQNCLSPS